ncbi:MAG: mechanosensitive ion channel [Clostridiales bacterium]|nr:mechanosensitive ion channel [Clostridiales bacterium]
MLNNSIIKKINKFVGNAGVNILYAAVFFFVGLMLIHVVNKMFRKGILKAKIDPMLHIFVLSVIRITLILLLAISCAGMIGLNVTSFITALGAAGLAVGLALQGSLTNLAGGVFIILTKPFGIHDYVEIGGEPGNVEQIGLAYTTLLTPDNRRVFIPNADVAKAKIINYSANSLRRLDLIFSIGNEEDFENAKRVICDVVEKNVLALKEPKPIIRCSGFSDNTIQIACRVWVSTDHYLDLSFDLYEQVKTAFDREGIRLPRQQLDIRIEKE